MKPLIYLTCFGGEIYAEMTHLCVASLRGAGQFQGDLIVFTDGNYLPDPRHQVRVVQVPPPPDRFEIGAFKWSADQHVDLASYDRVMVLDVDIIAIDAIQPIFDFCKSGVCAAEELSFCAYDFPSMGACLSPAELAANEGKWGINCGAVCFERGALQESLATMRAAVRAFKPHSVHFVDQPPFNALVVRKQLDFTPLPARWVDFPLLYNWRKLETVIGPSTKLLHYCGTGKLETLGKMQLSESLVASIRRGENDALRRKRLAWLHEMEAAKQFHLDQSQKWQAEAEYQRGQARNWETEARYYMGDSERWRAEAEYQTAHAKRVEAELEMRGRAGSAPEKNPPADPDDHSGHGKH